MMWDVVGWSGWLQNVLLDQSLGSTKWVYTIHNNFLKERKNISILTTKTFI
jgi:hypothetical protein